MLSDEDKRRIDAEEAYRAQVRGKQGPVEVKMKVPRVQKVIIWVFAIVLFSIAACVMLAPSGMR